MLKYLTKINLSFDFLLQNTNHFMFYVYLIKVTFRSTDAL